MVRDPYSGLVEPGPKLFEAPGIRIVLEPDEPPDDLPRRLARATAIKLADQWWPRLPQALRDERADVMATEYVMPMGLLFKALDELPRLPRARFPWRVLQAVRPWPVDDDGRPTRPLSAVALVRSEAALIAEIAARRAGGGDTASEEHALAQVRAQLGDKRRRRAGTDLGHLTPAMERDAARLASAIDKVIPDSRPRGGNKSGVFRDEVLRAVHEILFALTGTRVPAFKEERPGSKKRITRRLVKLIQQHRSR